MLARGRSGIGRGVREGLAVRRGVDVLRRVVEEGECRIGGESPEPLGLVGIIRLAVVSDGEFVRHGGFSYLGLSGMRSMPYALAVLVGHAPHAAGPFQSPARETVS